jgi:hypothetical protein
VRSWGHRFGQQAAAQADVAARLQKEAAARTIGAPAQPVTFLRQRRSGCASQAVDDQPERLAAGVGIDGSDERNHVGLGLSEVEGYANTSLECDLPL